MKVTDKYNEETEELDDGLKNIKGDIADLTKTASTPGGISIYSDESTKELKSTKQLLGEIADIYDDLNDKQQADLLEKIGGKRGGQVVGSLLRNWEAVDKAMETMEDSAGSADREMSKIEEGWDYKLNKLGETWVGVLQKMVDRKGFGSVMDMLQGISGAVSGLTDTFGGLSTALGGFFSVLAVKGSSPLLNYNMKSGNKGGFLWPGNIKESLANRKELSSYKGLTEQDVVMLQNYNKAIDSGAPKFQAFKQNMDGCSKTAKTLAVDMAAGRKSMDQISAGFEQVNKTSKLATFGMKALSIAGNMVLGMAIGAGISFVVGLIDDFIHRVDHAKEALEKFNSEVEEGRKRINDQSKWIEENGAEYEKLAKGVDAYGNNVSLTSAEFDKYRNITKQIADMFPDMVAGWNAQGDAILKYSGNVDALNESLEKNKEKENSRIRGTAAEVFKNYETVAKDTVREGSFAYDSFKNNSIFDKDLKSTLMIDGITKQVVGVLNPSEYDGILRNIASKIFPDDDEMISLFEEETRKLVDNGIIPAFEYYSETIQQAAKDVELSSEDMIADELDAMRSLMQAFAEGPDTKFKDLTDEQKAGISTFINTADDSFIKQFGGDYTKLKAWLKNNLVGNDSITSIFQEAYGASKDDFDSFSHYINYIEQLLDRLRNLQGVDGKPLVSESVIDSIKQSLGVSDQLLTGEAGGKRLINDVKEAYKNIPGVDKFIDTLSEDNIRKLYEKKDILGNTRNYNEFLLKYKTELGKTSDNMEEIIDAAKEYRKNTKKASKYYKDTMSDALQFDINPRKTKYGNIDTNKRDVINNKDSISTVLGTWGSFSLKSGELIDAAWSPIVQAVDSDNGQTKKIADDMAMKYIQSLIESLENQGKVVNKENILKLDSEGTVIDGTKIKNIIADIGATAEDTAAKMHFVGELGAFNLASEDGWSMTDDYEIRKNLREKLARTTSSILGDNWSNTQETGFANQANDTIESIKKIDDALTKLANGSFNDGDYYTLLKEFPDITKDTDNLESALKKLKSESSNNQLTAINDALDDYKLYIDAATEGTIDFEQEDLDNAVVAYQRLQDLRDGFLETSGAIIDAKDRFQEWQTALSTSNAGATYDTMVGGLEQFKKDLAEGLIGTDDSITFAKMFTPEGSEVDFQKSLDKAKRYLTENFDGLQHFLDDAVKKGVAKKGKNGMYDIFYQDLDKAAKKMKLPLSTMKSMMLKLRDYGFDVSVYKDSADALDQYITKTSEIAKLESEKASGISWTKDKQKELQGLKRDAKEAKKAYEELLKVDASEIAERAEKGTKAADALWEEMQKIDNEEGAYKGLNTQAKKDAAKNQIVQFYQDLKTQYGAEHENFEQYINGLDVLPDNADTKQDTATTSWEVADENRKELNKQADALKELKDNSVEAKESLTNVNNLLPKIDEAAKKPTMENMNRSLVTTQQKLNSIKNTLDGIGNKKVSIDTTTSSSSKTPSVGTVRYNGSSKEKWNGKTWVPLVNGTVSGLGFAKGNALIGELGPELLVRDDKWHLMGQFGAEMFDYREGDIIFNHKQTEDLLKSGSIRGRGTALLHGNAFDNGRAEGKRTTYGKDKTSKEKKTKTKTKTNKTNKDTKKEKQEIDWLERRLNRIQTIIDTISAGVENIGKWALKIKKGKVLEIVPKLSNAADNTRIKKVNQALDEEIKYYKKLYAEQSRAETMYQKRADAYLKGGRKGDTKVKKKESMYGLLGKKKAKKIVKKIQSGDYTKGDLKYWFNTYGEDAYNAIQNYITAYDKGQDAKKNKEATAQAARDAKIQKAQNKQDLYDKRISRAEAKESYYVGADRKNKFVEIQLDNLKKSYAQQKEIAKLNGDYAEYERLTYEEKTKQRELLYHEIENIKDEYEILRSANDRRIQDADNLLSVAEAEGRRVNTGWYTSKNINERKNYDYWSDERKKILEKLDGLEEGSTEWNNAMNDLQETENGMTEAQKNIADNTSAIRQIVDDVYNEMVENNNRFYDNAKFLAGLQRGENINTADRNDSYYRFTDTGLANMAAARTGIGVAMSNQSLYLKQKKYTSSLLDDIKKKGLSGKEADEYIKSLNDPLYSSYDQLEKADKEYTELWKKNREAQAEAENTLIDLMKEYYEGQKAYLSEIIDARKKIFDEEKDLYDYEKNINEKTKNIATLQKRLAAIQGDNSEAGKARRQQIQSQLDQAQQDLQDTQYDKWKSDQEAMLDNLSTQYNDIVDRHLKNPEALLSEAKDFLSDNNSKITAIEQGLKNSLPDGIRNEFNNVLDMDLSTIGNKLDGINSNLTTYLQEQKGARNNATEQPSGSQGDPTGKNGKNDRTSESPSTTSKAPSLREVNQKFDDALLKNSAIPKKKKGEYSDLNQAFYTYTKEEWGRAHILTKANADKFMKALGLDTIWDNNWTKDGAVYKYLKNLRLSGFKTGGIGRLVKASGEDGLAMVRDGEGFVAPESVNTVQKWMDSAPDITEMLNMINKNGTGGNTTIGDLYFDLPNVTDARSLIETFQNSKDMQRLLKIGVEDLMGQGKFSNKIFTV